VRDDAVGDIAQPLQLRVVHRRQCALVAGLHQHRAVLLRGRGLDLFGRHELGEGRSLADVVPQAVLRPGRAGQRRQAGAGQQAGEQAALAPCAQGTAGMSCGRVERGGVVAEHGAVGPRRCSWGSIPF